MTTKEVNWVVVIQSVVALAFLAATFLASWWFIVPVGILVFLNQRELMKKH